MKKCGVKKSKFISEIIFLCGLVVLWQLLYVLGVNVLSVWKPYAMPSPVGVFKSFGTLMTDGSLLRAVGYSLLRGIGGYMISVVIGCFLGFLLSHFPYLYQNLRPVVMGIQTLPSVCWVPFSILWFGLTQQAIIFVVIMGSAFSIAIAADNAIHNVPVIYKKAALTMGANPNPDKPEKFILYLSPLCYSKEKGGFPSCYLQINTPIRFMVSLPVMTA